jgi:leucyl aminopeptidase
MDLTISIGSHSSDVRLLLFHDAKSGSGRSKALNSLTDSQLKRLEDAPKAKLIHLPSADDLLVAVCIDEEDESMTAIDALRKCGAQVYALCNAQKAASLQVDGDLNSTEHSAAVIEGLLLSDYRFDQLKSEQKAPELKQVTVADTLLSAKALDELVALTNSVHWARDLVNLPLSHLTAEKFAEAVETSGTANGYSVEVLNKKKIEALKMGGLLAVNKGSIDPPTFTIAEWKPDNAVNQQPIVLVGKGVVYDTGGISLKPTANSMDFMKSDMAGAAMMAATVDAAARLKLPLHIVALLPATDNRPDGNAIVPGDVITMHDGTTVEVKNTDAEGRLLLGDALHYAKKYNPDLVIDAATLTGAAVRAIGTYGACTMGTADPETFSTLLSSGDTVFERLVQFPMWSEYADELKSDVADMSNLGKGEGGQMSAGAFLKHFTDYPWIHIDIAGPSFLHAPDGYRTKGGSGHGVRLLIHFLQKHYLK